MEAQQFSVTDGIKDTSFRQVSCYKRLERFKNSKAEKTK
jgi:hypothetical protein